MEVRETKGVLFLTQSVGKRTKRGGLDSFRLFFNLIKEEVKPLNMQGGSTTVLARPHRVLITENYALHEYHRKRPVPVRVAARVTKLALIESMQARKNVE